MTIAITPRAKPSRYFVEYQGDGQGDTSRAWRHPDGSIYKQLSELTVPVVSDAEAEAEPAPAKK